MPMSIDWGYGVDTLWTGIDNFEPKTREAIEEKVLEAAVNMLQYARDNAPWEDRTGSARKLLDTEVFNEDNKIGISLHHGVDYGIWLEIRWGATYAIILPTIEKFGPELMDSMTKILTGITYYA